MTPEQFAQLLSAIRALDQSLGVIAILLFLRLLKK